MAAVPAGAALDVAREVLHQLGALPELVEAMKRDEVAQRIRAAGRVEDWARDDEHRSRKAFQRAVARGGRLVRKGMRRDEDELVFQGLLELVTVAGLSVDQVLLLAGVAVDLVDEDGEE